MNRSFISIKIGEYLFGIDLKYVREVNHFLDITPVALAPDFVAGLMNLRGQIVTVIDPGIKLHMAKRNVSSTSRCVILKTATEDATISLKDILGILVDSIGDILTVDSSEIEPSPPNIGEIDEQLISGIVKLENELLIILKMETVLQAA
ncbi:MAG TPA: chemotaxis protein CheW [Chitinispirillaceae bacterium]|nr:chemotaxis protein CheW [Chitinispirillaceae bacterium]